MNCAAIVLANACVLYPWLCLKLHSATALQSLQQCPSAHHLDSWAVTEMAWSTRRLSLGVWMFQARPL